jgi:hypothetical protein
MLTAAFPHRGYAGGDPLPRVQHNEEVGGTALPCTGIGSAGRRDVWRASDMRADGDSLRTGPPPIIWKV